MSASPDENEIEPPEALSGDHLIVTAVNEPGSDTEEEHVIGQTMGDVEPERDTETVETTLHENETTQQHAGHSTYTVSLTLAAVPDQPQLETLQLYDENGEWIGPAQWHAIRIYIYTNEPSIDDEAADSWEFWGCEVDTELPTYATGDPGEVPITIRVNGGHMHGVSKAGGGTTSGA